MEFQPACPTPISYVLNEAADDGQSFGLGDSDFSVNHLNDGPEAVGGALVAAGSQEPVLSLNPVAATGAVVQPTNHLVPQSSSQPGLLLGQIGLSHRMTEVMRTTLTSRGVRFHAVVDFDFNPPMRQDLDSFSGPTGHQFLGGPSGGEIVPYQNNQTSLHHFMPPVLNCWVGNCSKLMNNQPLLEIPETSTSAQYYSHPPPPPLSTLLSLHDLMNNNSHLVSDNNADVKPSGILESNHQPSFMRQRSEPLSQPEPAVDYLQNWPNPSGSAARIRQGPEPWSPLKPVVDYLKNQPNPPEQAVRIREGPKPWSHQNQPKAFEPVVRITEGPGSCSQPKPAVDSRQNRSKPSAPVLRITDRSEPRSPPKPAVGYLQNRPKPSAMAVQIGNSSQKRAAGPMIGSSRPRRCTILLKETVQPLPLINAKRPRGRPPLKKRAQPLPLPPPPPPTEGEETATAEKTKGNDRDYDGRTHSLTKRKYGPYTCPKCRKIFGISQSFASHVQSHYLRDESRAERIKRQLAKHKKQGFKLVQSRQGITVMPISAIKPQSNVVEVLDKRKWGLELGISTKEEKGESESQRNQMRIPPPPGMTIPPPPGFPEPLWKASLPVVKATIPPPPGFPHPLEKASPPIMKVEVDN